MKGKFTRAAIVAAVSMAAVGIGAGAPLMAAGPTSADIANDANTPGDVLSYGMGPWAQRFSTLDQVNTGNVAKLTPV